MSVGAPEILVILIVALVVFGPQRLPDVARQVGTAVRELRKMQDTVRGELDMVLHPEHGTRPGDAPEVTDVPSEPGDHTAVSAAEFISGDARPVDVTSVEIQPDQDADDEDRRFHGPPDSFI